MLSEAKHLLFSRRNENKSRFFSPAKSAGPQNDSHGFFAGLLDDFDGAVRRRKSYGKRARENFAQGC